MNKNVEVLLAGALGLFAIVGALAVRKVLKEKSYSADYTDTHKLFSKKFKNQFTEHGDGIEINALL
ncbi:hypothetical protein SAMN05660477_02273 [Soonwooa buanensis]|uniref:Uncharacterized protein n=1 Tax=Soonwooa buanensis TaxID=619805 RepID=A0A1T5FU04_9FLAO|nr:hypothetical protein [Soonwooa buanensis]SKB99610.1 hypothetical protein SAMN05660477_02273 [Soonwooa buanensis]